MKLCSNAVFGSLLVVLMAGITLGCKSTGQGSGESSTGEVTASFNWEESGPTSGTLQATVTRPNSPPEMYQGKFYQITKDTRVDTIGALWNPWYPGWHGWEFWGPVPDISFIQHYTGRVVANLAGPNGQRMRCQFRLLRSSEGMKGGGQGQCQLASGQTIDAEFPPS